MKRSGVKALARLLALCLGLAILGVLLHTVGWRSLAEVMQAADRRLLGIALLLFVPQVAVMSWRWLLIGGTAQRMTFWTACRMVLAGSSLNVVLPSKMGDLCKGFMVAGREDTGLARGLGMAALDKLMDVMGLAAVLVVAGAFAPKAETWVLGLWAATTAGVVVLLVLMHWAPLIEPLPRRKVMASLARALNAAFRVRQHRAVWGGALVLSLVLWVLHVGQIFIFYRAVGGAAPALAVWSRVPMGIFIGLLPVTVAGIGTRDAAFFVLMSAWDAESVIAWLGLFCTLRYVVMALLGVPAVISLGPLVGEALRARGQVDLPPADGNG